MGSCSCNLKNSVSTASTCPTCYHSSLSQEIQWSLWTIHPKLQEPSYLSQLSQECLTSQLSRQCRKAFLFADPYYIPRRPRNRDLMSPSLGLVLVMFTGMPPRQRLWSSQAGYWLRALLSCQPALGNFQQDGILKGYITPLPHIHAIGLSLYREIRPPITGAQAEGEQLTQSHTASRVQRQDLNPGLSVAISQVRTQVRRGIQ